MADEGEGFLGRWSRLKREAANPAKEMEAQAAADQVAPDPSAAASAADDATTPPAASEGAEVGQESKRPALDLENIDFDSLDGNSDYKPFMSPDVPDEIRNKALARLWVSDPVLSAPEQLSDYMEDFTDAACAVPAGMLRTAYKVGQGFLSDEEAAEWDRLGRKQQPAPAAEVPIAIGPENPDQPDIRALLAASDAYAQSLYPPESNHLVDLGALMAPNAQVFVARQDGKALGCGALIIAEDGSGEVKRMWVEPDARRHGLGRKLLAAIEAAARERSIDILRLETGIRQPEAIGLYRSSGFTECEPFGTYRPDSLSLFMEKRLG